DIKLFSSKFVWEMTSRMQAYHQFYQTRIHSTSCFHIHHTQIARSR
uniref:Uncharacterized protein n=1 Tax=Aegilops tauschii subsp. strangulata TaxID=200361 RepID=A0A453P3W0_AEGTS